MLLMRLFGHYSGSSVQGPNRLQSCPAHRAMSFAKERQDDRVRSSSCWLVRTYCFRDLRTQLSISRQFHRPDCARPHVHAGTVQTAPIVGFRRAEEIAAISPYHVVHPLGSLESLIAHTLGKHV